MKKNNFANKLKQSLQQEADHIDLRFEKADQILLKEEVVKKKDEKSKKKTLSITISEELIDSLESCIRKA
jgi:gamma-glutamyl phosphate reductase